MSLAMSNYKFDTEKALRWMKGQPLRLMVIRVWQIEVDLKTLLNGKVIASNPLLRIMQTVKRIVLPIRTYRTLSYLFKRVFIL